MKVIIRPFKPHEDSGIIFGTFPRNAYYIHRKTLKTKLTKDQLKAWMNTFTEHVRELLENADIRIACMYDDPSTILGYAIINYDTCEFVYVKELHRQQGIAKFLVPDNIKKFNHITRLGRIILDARDNRAKEEARTEASKDGRGILSNEPDSTND